MGWKRHCMLPSDCRLTHFNKYVYVTFISHYPLLGVRPILFAHDTLESKRCVDEELLSVHIFHRATLNRGEPMVPSTQIMGGRFRRGLHSDVVTFQLDSLFSPRPCAKVMGKKQDGSPLFLYPAF